MQKEFSWPAMRWNFNDNQWRDATGVFGNEDAVREVCREIYDIIKKNPTHEFSIVAGRDYRNIPGVVCALARYKGNSGK